MIANLAKILICEVKYMFWTYEFSSLFTFLEFMKKTKDVIIKKNGLLALATFHKAFLIKFPKEETEFLALIIVQDDDFDNINNALTCLCRAHDWSDFVTLRNTGCLAKLISFCKLILIKV